MIDPHWNATCTNDHRYKDIILDIYCPQAVNIEHVEDLEGLAHLAKTLKHHAKQNTQVDSEAYLEGNPDYGLDVTRTQDIENLNCWFGYIYTKNESKHVLSETLRPQLEGIEVFYPRLAPGEQDIKLRVPPGRDHIVILRRVASDCSYSLAYRTESRQLSDKELVQKAKEMGDGDKKLIGDTKAFFKLLNSEGNFVFYFENPEKSTLQLTFDLQMENLQI